MKVISSNDDSSFHFHTMNNSSENTSTDTNITSEWTLFVNVCALYGLKMLRKVMESSYYLTIQILDCTLWGTADLMLFPIIFIIIRTNKIKSEQVISNILYNAVIKTK